MPCRASGRFAGAPDKYGDPTRSGDGKAFGKVVDIWPDGKMPGDKTDKPEVFDNGQPKGDVNYQYVSHPTLTIRKAPGDGIHPAMLICPGGGYFLLAWRHEGMEIADFVHWAPGYAYATVEKPFMESPECDGFNMKRGERETADAKALAVKSGNGERACVISEEFALERDLRLSRIGFYLTDGEGGTVRFALREKDGAELFEVPVDYAPQGYGLAFLEISARRRPVLKAGVRYVLEMRGAKGEATCYWRRSRDGDKRHAFALYGAGERKEMVE